MELTYEMIENHMNNLSVAMEKCDDQDPGSVEHLVNFFAPHSVTRSGDIGMGGNSRDGKKMLAVENHNHFRLKLVYNTPENYWIIDEKKKIVAGIVRELLYDPKEDLVDGDCAYYVHFGLDLIDDEVKIVWEHKLAIDAVYRGNQVDDLPYSNKDLGFRYDPLSEEDKKLKYEDMLRVLHECHAKMGGINAGPETTTETVRNLYIPAAPSMFTDVAKVVSSDFMLDNLAEKDLKCELIDNRAPYYSIIDDRKKMGAAWLAEEMTKDLQRLALIQFFVHYAFTAVEGQPKMKWMRMSAVPTKFMVDSPDGKNIEHYFKD